MKSDRKIFLFIPQFFSEDNMKKTIGFIDNFIDEWHSSNYPSMISQSSLKDEFALTYAWEIAPHPERRPLGKWCADNGMIPARSMEEVVEKCDCIAVLSPNNAELHEQLADLALRSGKPLYIDKTFAPDLNAAKRMFALARKHHTPLMSTSALRYAPGLTALLREKVAGEKVNYVCTFGNGLSFEFYGVHQVEMLVLAIGTGAKRVMMNTAARNRSLTVAYTDGRLGVVNYLPELNFRVVMQYGESACADTGDLGTGHFPAFVEQMLTFFKTGVPQVPEEQTLEVMAILESAFLAQKTPGKWIPLAEMQS